MAITTEEFGSIDGRHVSLYTLTNHLGLVAKFTNFGGILTEMHTPDRKGKLADIVLGYDTLEEYINQTTYFGCMIGRCANRIDHGRFTLDGETYQLATNLDPHHLHGGILGFDKVVWDAETNETVIGASVKLHYMSVDGEEGYPGNLNVTVVYMLTNDTDLIIEMTATTDQPTIVNMVNHTYWNLAGHDAGLILNHEVFIPADYYTPTDETLLPTGEIAPVAGTPFDFTKPKTFRKDIDELPPNGPDPGGYDHNIVLRGEAEKMKLAVRVREPASGRVLEVRANQPSLQFYSGNFLTTTKGKKSAIYEQHAGMCLETQKFPDSINKQGKQGWPNFILRPGEKYQHIMICRFLTQ